MGRPVSDRRALMRAAHAACRQLGLDDATRHDVQLAVTGKASMRDMAATDLANLLDHLNGKSGRAGAARHKHPLAPRADLRLIHALWGELGRRGALRRPGRDGLNAFIRARFGPHWSFVPLDVDALSDTQNITDVVRALKAMLARTDHPQDDGPGEGCAT
ncbi:phage protein GemA/Gp16 family protein [Ruegeria sp.]|uniref:phage protein GemA/Gp16 family protein n=1 Tax=Ruegeria sp. TaxID=1879320 RepID=UPI003B5957F0